MNASVYFTRQQARDPHLLVVGGGPAGSSFALFALDYAQRAGIDLQVTIFEPRDFTRPGPWGCNMGAGLIPVRMLQHLAEIDVTVPPHVIRNHISSYTLHTAAGQIHLPQPDPVGDVIGVYRGNGPRNGPDWGTCISFDHFLLQAAQERGAQVIHERVTHISLSPHTFVATREGRYTGSLVVLATGVNSGGLETEGLDYQPPRRSKMAQVELFLGEELVEERLQGSVHIVLPQNNQLKFGTLVPKGPCINVSLLGGDLPSGSVERFLQLPEVRSVLPEGVQNRACGCRPYISVGAARPLYADRFVAIGDAGITRLYKNGIGTGLRTARRAAFTAINYGTT
ncbi:MAG: FAD-dependent oxidoreductase, partial [Caldilineae bacterium]